MPTLLSCAMQAGLAHEPFRAVLEGRVDVLRQLLLHGADMHAPYDGFSAQYAPDDGAAGMELLRVGARPPPCTRP